MKKLLLSTVLLASLIGLTPAAFAEDAVTRCGWVQNPTPGNWWLTDAEGDWTLMTQGADDEPRGMDLIGDISAHDYVMTNGNYGYACGCMKVFDDNESKKIYEVLSFRQLPLSKCDRDPNLPKMD